MKRRKIQHVQQKHDKGCVVACIAMVLGWDYDKVATEFHNDFDKRGIKTDFAKELICAHGFSVIEKRGDGYIDRHEHNKRMMQPFAPIHIVTVQQFVDTPSHTHAFVMDAKGKIYEPGDKSMKEVLFYEVKHVMGFFET
jgi:hypothetical protein